MGFGKTQLQQRMKLQELVRILGCIVARRDGPQPNRLTQAVGSTSLINW